MATHASVPASSAGQATVRATGVSRRYHTRDRASDLYRTTALPDTHAQPRHSRRARKSCYWHPSPWPTAANPVCWFALAEKTRGSEAASRQPVTRLTPAA